jgi:hypothetical protein
MRGAHTSRRTHCAGPEAGAPSLNLVTTWFLQSTFDVQPAIHVLPHLPSDTKRHTPWLGYITKDDRNLLGLHRCNQATLSDTPPTGGEGGGWQKFGEAVTSLKKLQCYKNLPSAFRNLAGVPHFSVRRSMFQTTPVFSAGRCGTTRDEAGFQPLTTWWSVLASRSGVGKYIGQ